MRGGGITSALSLTVKMACGQVASECVCQQGSRQEHFFQVHAYLEGSQDYRIGFHNQL